jgi:hypothetical protein
VLYNFPISVYLDFCRVESAVNCLLKRVFFPAASCL